MDILKQDIKATHEWYLRENEFRSKQWEQAKQMKNYSIQIKQAISVNKVIKADSMENALKIAEVLAGGAEGEPLVVPKKGWTLEWNDEAEVLGVFQ